jgi:adenylate kinase
MKLDAVIALQIEPEALIQRITARRTCAKCGAITNLVVDKLKSDSPCPSCGGELLQREDDNEAVVRQRIESYRRETEPLLDHYQARGILYPVDGLGTADEVGSRVVAVLGTIGNARRT